MTNDAEYYQQHKDDPDEWGDPEPARKPSRRMAAMISARFTPEEEDIVRGEAARRGESVSALIRAATLRECGRAVPVVMPLATTMTFACSWGVHLVHDQAVLSGAPGTR
ncbi:MAG: hypothetical protein ACRDZ7_12920 [Acidimicrobiia bacterium]